MALHPRLTQLSRAFCGTRSRVATRLERFRTYVKEDPTVTYDLHAAFSKDPNTVRVEDAYDEYTKIKLAALRAGKRPPRKTKHKLDAIGNIVGARHTNYKIPRRVRERLIEEGLKMKPQFFIGRFGLNKVLVSRIRSAFRVHELVRIEVGSPWTDNTEKLAERLELRTGAIVLDRAGGRFFLYRGFTHADLARKGLLDPNCFTVENFTPPRTETGMESLKQSGGFYMKATVKLNSDVDLWEDQGNETGGVRSESTSIDVDEECEVLMHNNDDTTQD
eukprot:g852.t1